LANTSPSPRRSPAPCEDTEGTPLEHPDYRPAAYPPLYDVAQPFGASTPVPVVEAVPGRGGRFVVTLPTA
jgi:hypothetical protein